MKNRAASGRLCTATPLIETSRAAAFGDIDNDGGVDILVVNKDGPAHVLRNIVADRGNWAALRVLDGNGRDAYGARVTIKLGDRTLTRHVRAAYSYCASNDPVIHLGLGEAMQIEVLEVLWVDGSTESFGTIGAGETTTLRQGQGD